MVEVEAAAVKRSEYVKGYRKIEANMCLGSNVHVNLAFPVGAILH